LSPPARTLRGPSNAAAVTSLGNGQRPNSVMVDFTRATNRYNHISLALSVTVLQYLITGLLTGGLAYVKLSLCLTKSHAMKTYPKLNYAPHDEDEWGSVSIAPHILNLGTRWR